MSSTESKQPQVQPEPAVSPQKESRLLRFVRDPLWQFLGAVIAIGLAVGGYYLQRPVKQVDVTLLASASLFDVRSEVADDIDVSYQGRTVEGLVFTDIRITNSGNQPITEGDYSVPIAITFDPAYEIVEARVTVSEPDDIGMQFTVRDGHIAEAEPVLLNANDFVEARFIILSDQPVQEVNVDVEGRIVGVKQIRYLTANQPQSAVHVWLSGIGFYGFMFALVGITLWAMWSAIGISENIWQRVAQKARVKKDEQE